MQPVPCFYVLETKKKSKEEEREKHRYHDSPGIMVLSSFELFHEDLALG